MVFITLHLLSCSKKEGLVMTHSLPDEISESSLYSLRVNGIKVPIEVLKPNMDMEKQPEWFRSAPYVHDQEIHIADFSAEGELSMELKISESFSEVNISPKSRQISPVIKEDRISFQLKGPDKLYIRIDSLPEFCLFVNPIEDKTTDTLLSNTRYFGPGIHRTGYLELKSNEDIYLAAGAYVLGGVRGNGVKDVRIYGRGVIEGEFKHRRMVLIENSSNITIEGISIRNGRGWTNTLTNCDDVKFDGVKVIGFGPSSDGINPLGSRNFEIKNSFFRCTDDCIAIKSPDSTLLTENITVTKNTMIGYAFSDGITIGFETNGPEIRNVQVKDCDILIARGGSRVDGHSAFSIICDGPAWIHDIVYENIRVEEPVRKLFELHVTDGTDYGINPPGRISDVYLKDVQWNSKRPIILSGYNSSHDIDNVTFENCFILDTLLTSVDSTIFNINEFVSGVSFK